MADRRQRFLLTLEATSTPSTVPAADRLKSLLKMARRLFHFRAISVLQLPHQQEPADPEGVPSYGRTHKEKRL
jgi:hypothetical protein